MKPKKLSFLFIMDPFKKIHLAYDTSVSLMVECQKRGHTILYAEPKELALTNTTLWANVRHVEVDVAKGFKVLGQNQIKAENVDCIFVRKDPPFDLEYLYMTYLLEAVADKTLVINSPRGIRNANEKLFSFQFEKWVPPSLATTDANAILAFQKSLGTDLVLKPLNRKAGEGVMRLKKVSRISYLPPNCVARPVHKGLCRAVGRTSPCFVAGVSRKNSAGKIPKQLRLATKNGEETILAQKFIKKGLTEGDKRILLWDGKVVGVFGRVPKRGEFRANLSLGGTAKKSRLTKREKEIIHALRPTLKQNGLIFVGLDTIDGWITEMNVTSPAGIADINGLYGTRVETGIVDWLETRLDFPSPLGRGKG